MEYILDAEDKPDAIINPFEKVWADGRRQVTGFKDVPLRTEVTYKEVNEYRYTLSLHALTIRTGIYRNNDIPAIDEKIYYDDMEYILYPVPYISKIVFLSKVVYEYRWGLPGQSMNPEQMRKKLPMHTKVIASLAEYYRNNKALFNREQSDYYVREFVDTFGGNIELLIDTSAGFDMINEKVKAYSDFPLEKTNKRTLKLTVRYGRAGYILSRVIGCLKGYISH